MSSISDKAAQTAQDFSDRYGLDNGNGEINVDEQTLQMTVEGTNNTTVTFELPVDQVTDANLAKAMSQAVDDLDVDDEFNELWSPDFADNNGFTPSGFIQNLQEDKTELTLKAAQAMQDAGLKATIDPEMNVLDVQMNANDITHMLADAGIQPTPDNILQAAQGSFPGRDGYYMAGYAAKASADILRQVVQEGRAEKDYGFDMADAPARQQDAPAR